MSDAVPAILICTLLFILPSELPPFPSCLANICAISSQLKTEHASSQSQCPLRRDSKDAINDVAVEGALNEAPPLRQSEKRDPQPSTQHHSTSSERKRRRVPRLLDWDTVHVKMPWCIILIMGGGLAMAEGMTETGLSDWLGEQFSVFSSGELLVCSIIL